MPVGRVLGLERHGWVRGEPQDAGAQNWIYRVLPGDRALVINLDPGISIGIAGESGDQTLEWVWLNDEPQGAWLPTGSARFGDLDPLTASEILRELTELKR